MPSAGGGRALDDCAMPNTGGGGGGIESVGCAMPNIGSGGGGTAIDDCAMSIIGCGLCEPNVEPNDTPEVPFRDLVSAENPTGVDPETDLKSCCAISFEPQGAPKKNPLPNPNDATLSLLESVFGEPNRPLVSLTEEIDPVGF